MNRNILLAAAFISLCISSQSKAGQFYQYPDMEIAPKTVRLVTLNKKVSKGIYNFSCVFTNERFNTKNPTQITIYNRADMSSRETIVLNKPEIIISKVVEIDNKNPTSIIYIENVRTETKLDTVYARGCLLNYIR